MRPENTEAMVAEIGLQEVLSIACLEDKIDVVKKLISMGVNTHNVKPDPLLLACSAGSLEVVKLLIGSRPEAIYIAHEAACAADKAAVVAWLEEQPGFELSLAGNSLCAASHAGHTGRVDKLIRANVTAVVGECGRTPLYWACANGKLETVKRLLRVYSRPMGERCSQPLCAALHVASRNGHDEVVNILLMNHCLNVDCVCTEDGSATALYEACLGNHVKVARILLIRGADPAKEAITQAEFAAVGGLLGVPTPDTKWTPFSIACASGHIDIVLLMWQSARDKILPLLTVECFKWTEEAFIEYMRAMLTDAAVKALEVESGITLPT
jgi:ankyrin repeat protein